MIASLLLHPTGCRTATARFVAVVVEVANIQESLRPEMSVKYVVLDRANECLARHTLITQRGRSPEPEMFKFLEACERTTAYRVHGLQESAMETP